jgi:hypothetical protein
VGLGVGVEGAAGGASGGWGVEMVVVVVLRVSRVGGVVGILRDIGGGSGWQWNGCGCGATGSAQLAAPNGSTTSDHRHHLPSSTSPAHHKKNPVWYALLSLQPPPLWMLNFYLGQTQLVRFSSREMAESLNF